jgi:hypothetical protein
LRALDLPLDEIRGILESADDAHKRKCLLALGRPSRESPLSGPSDIQGMPRTAQLKGPSGNQIGLYQA